MADDRRKQALERFQRQNVVLEGINRVFREALTCETEEQLGGVCLEVAEQITASPFGFLGEINAEGQLDDIAISDPGWQACRMGAPGAHHLLPSGLKAHGLYGKVLLEGKGFFTNDPGSHPDSIGLPPGHPPLTSFLGVPLIRAGKTVGMVGVGNREGGYREEDLAALEMLSATIVQALAHKRAEDELQKYRTRLEERVGERTRELETSTRRLKAEIDERKRAEQALRASEEHFHSLVDSMEQLAWSADASGAILWLNRRWLEYCGDRPEQMKGRGWLKWLHPDHSNRVIRSYRTAIHGGQAWEDTFPLRGKDGHYRWFLSRAVPVRDEAGRLLRWLGTCTDITAFRLADQQLRDTQARLLLAQKAGGVGWFDHDLASGTSIWS